MKICLIAPGIMPIPPLKWGAVEMMLWDYFNILSDMGHWVEIINTPDRQEIVKRVNAGKFDAIHLHYDVFTPIMSNLEARVKILSSHYPFISDSSKHAQDGYSNILPHIINNKDFHIFASSQRDIDTFVYYGADRDNTFLSKLGVRKDSYSFKDYPELDRTLCFSQIVDRKRQYLIQDFDDVDFSGQLNDPKFNNSPGYKGEYEREVLNKIITNYSNFVLLSSVENATPLAVKEALMCGLGIVASEAVAQELSKNLPFVSIIPENRMGDKNYIKEVLKENRAVSQKLRPEIREYAIEKFSLESILKKSYIPKIESLLR